MTRAPAQDLDPAAVSEANRQLWENHPELTGRQLTMGSQDATYRREWMSLYIQSKNEACCPPPPQVEPSPAAPPPPVVVDAPEPCQGVANLTHEQKMEEAINRAPISDAIRQQLGDIPTLVATMVVTVGALAALAATGYGAVAEAVGVVLLVAGAAIGGYDVGGGIMSLIDFYQQTRCDTAKTPEDLDKAGKSFADGVAKMGIGGITLLLSFAGAEELGAEGPAAEAAEAAAAQGNGTYPGVDAWSNTILAKGDVVVQGVGGDSNFFFPQETLDQAGLDHQQLWDSLQVRESPTSGPRMSVNIYEVTDDTPAAESLAESNTLYGEGGGRQLYIGDKSSLKLVGQIPLR